MFTDVIRKLYGGVRDEEKEITLDVIDRGALGSLEYKLLGSRPNWNCSGWYLLLAESDGLHSPMALWTFGLIRWINPDRGLSGKAGNWREKFTNFVFKLDKEVFTVMNPPAKSTTVGKVIHQGKFRRLPYRLITGQHGGDSMTAGWAVLEIVDAQGEQVPVVIWDDQLLSHKPVWIHPWAAGSSYVRMIIGRIDKKIFY